MNLTENVFGGVGNKPNLLRTKTYKVKTDVINLKGRPLSRGSNATTGYNLSSTDINWGASRNGVQSVSAWNTTSSTKSNTTSENESHMVVGISEIFNIFEMHQNQEIANCSITKADSKFLIPPEKAITEGRGHAMCEVGIAAMDCLKPTLILCQISDSHSYINTLTKINILNPNEILLPLSLVESQIKNRLVEKIKQYFGHVRITGIARNAFMKTHGSECIQNLCLQEYDSISLMVQHKYYALSAVSALILYAENNLNKYFAKKSMKIVYQGLEGGLIIDVSTADKLELVACARPSMSGKYTSLFGILNYCLTKIGARTLRSSILQPSSSVREIETRLDCVEELIKNPEILNLLKGYLSKISQIDQILSLPTVLPDSSENCSERQLNYLLQLNSILEQIVPLKSILQDAKHVFFTETVNTLNSETFNTVIKILREVIHNEAYPAKGPNAIMQRCFAIRTGVNGLLDHIRSVYSQRLEEMREYVASLGRKHGLQLTLNNNNKKGYHIVLQLNKQQRKTFKKSDLPLEFTQVFRLATFFTMKTPELVNYSTRLDDIVEEILKISNNIIFHTLSEIRIHSSQFYKLCEAIAKIDVIQALAQASGGSGYVRPTFSDYTEVENAKHPLLDFLCAKEPVSNPIQASKEYNVHIITGPNGAGKSVYIRQIALIQIMAQLGCYVPATSAVLHVADRIFSRLSMDDNMECGVSTFELELREVKHFLKNATSKSLIIIDELCRSTSLEQGTALAYAIIEKLMKTKAFIYLTTHYTIITKMQDMYCNVKVWQLEAHASGTNVRDMHLELKYNLLPGCTTLRRYSIYLVRKLWDESIVNQIEELMNEITRNQQESSAEAIDPRRRLIYDIEHEMQRLKTNKMLTQSVLHTILNKHLDKLQEYGITIQGYETSIDFDNNADTPVVNFLDQHQPYPMPNFDAMSTRIDEYDPFVRVLPADEESVYNSPQSRSYTMLDNFIRENPENIDLLCPDISLSLNSPPKFTTPYSSQNIQWFNRPKHFLQDNFFQCRDHNNTQFLSFIDNESYVPSHNSSFESFVRPQNFVNYNLQVVVFDNKDHRGKQKNAVTASSSSTNEQKFSAPLQKDIHRTSTPLRTEVIVHHNPNMNITAEELSSIVEELHTCNEELFAEWQTTESDNVQKKCAENANVQASISKEKAADDSSSISYSPLSRASVLTSTSDTIQNKSETNDNVAVTHITFNEHSNKSSSNIGNSSKNLNVPQKDGVTNNEKENPPETSKLLERETTSNKTITASYNKSGFTLAPKRKRKFQFSSARLCKSNAVTSKNSTQKVLEPNDSGLAVKPNNHSERDNKTLRHITSNERSNESSSNIRSCSSLEAPTSSKTSNANIEDDQINSQNVSSNNSIVNKNQCDNEKEKHPKTSALLESESTSNKTIHASYNKSGFSFAPKRKRKFQCRSKSSTITPKNDATQKVSEPNDNSFATKPTDELKNSIKTKTLSLRHVTSSEHLSKSNSAIQNCSKNSSLEDPASSKTSIAKSSENQSSSQKLTSDDTVINIYPCGNEKEKLQKTSERIECESSCSTTTTTSYHTGESSLASQGQRKFSASFRSHSQLSRSNIVTPVNDITQKVSEHIDNSVATKPPDELENSVKNLSLRHITSSERSSKNSSTIQNCSKNSSLEVSDSSKTSIAKSSDNQSSTKNLSSKDSVIDINVCAIENEKQPKTSEQRNSENTPSYNMSEFTLAPKRRKFRPPILSPNHTVKTKVKSGVLKKRRPRLQSTFNPPKITKRQIQEEFNKQDLKMMNDVNESNVSTYGERILNRPSVRQIQDSKTIALIRKTDHGVVVIPPEPKKTRKRKCLFDPFKFIQKKWVDVSIFSDKNADYFEKLVNSSEKKSFLPKSASFTFGESNKDDFNFHGSQTVTVRKRDIFTMQQDSTQKTFTTKKNSNVFSQSNISQESSSNYLSLTPVGYYKENKDKINGLINKYLKCDS